MTWKEVEGFRETLTARVAELERITRQRDGITIERSADPVDEVQSSSERALAAGNLDRDCSQLRDAGELGIGEITVKAHRGRVMQKVRAESLADLVNIPASLGLGRGRSASGAPD